MPETNFDFGMIGLGTMGRALLLNMADHGFAVAGFDTDPKKVEALHAEGASEKVKGFGDPKKFVQAIRKPRAIMMLVPAGDPMAMPSAIVGGTFMPVTLRSVTSTSPSAPAENE